jgi:electron transfer flavoprotein beta subunit
MVRKALDILVLLREVCDPRPPAQLGPEGAVIRERGLRRLINPSDLEALEVALGLAGARDARVTAVAVGPERLEDDLRLALSMGVGRAVRIWGHALAGADAVAEGRLVARIIQVLDPTLVLTGARLLDRGDAPAPSVAASLLGIPYSTSAVGLQLKDGSVEVLKKGDRGARQRVTLPLPCAVLFEAAFREPRYPDLEAVTQSLDSEVEVWGLPELGLPSPEVGEAGALLRLDRFAFPRPTPVRVATPDANLPAFDRIRTLLSGGIQPREGKMHFGTANEVADQLFGVFLREGLIPGDES